TSSLSVSSRVSQAVWQSIVSSQATSSVVLPKPAGADSKVRLLLSPAFKRSMRQVRAITSLLVRGRESLGRIKGPGWGEVAGAGSLEAGATIWSASGGSVGACA